MMMLTLMACLGLAAGEKAVGNWHIVPLPRDMQAVAEAPFAIDSKVTVHYPEGDERQQRNAELLAGYVKELTGISLQTTTRERGRQIRLAVRAMQEGNEAYRIEVTRSGVTIEGGSHAGVFYGMQSLMKALPIVASAKRVYLPAVRIADAPRFGYRAFMIDVGRHFFSIDYLKKLVDVMAMHNMNYFHWHLTEDQGWRIEIKKYPKLTEIGSVRRETTLGGKKGYDGVPVSGFYTQEEAKDLVAYAAERYITVIPEIDMPGHMQAALASYPTLGCTGGPYEVCCDFGVIDDVLCAGKPSTLQFAKDVIDEVMDIFPSHYIHIGGDECPKKRWKACAACQEKIAQLGLQDIPGHSREDQLQTWFMGEIQKEIKSRGRVVMGWDEVLDGTPSKDITVCAWTSPKAGVRAAKEGHRTIICPISNFYFSNPHWNKLTGMPSIQRVYDHEPCSDELTPAEQANIIGAEGCIWTEWVKDAKKLEWEMLPRIAALCEVQWTAKEKRNLNDFCLRLLHMQDLYRHYGLNYKEDIEEAIRQQLVKP